MYGTNMHAICESTARTAGVSRVLSWRWAGGRRSSTAASATRPQCKGRAQPLPLTLPLLSQVNSHLAKFHHMSRWSQWKI